MATKPRTTKTPAAATAATAAELATATTARTADLHLARMMTGGQSNAFVVRSYTAPEADILQALVDVCGKQAQAIGEGDLSGLEYMLLTQATALQAMFVDLATRAKRQDRFDGIQTMTTLALKCAAQSRQAVTALAELRTPKTVMFAKQANVTSGPQQVNNGVAAPALPARAEEIQNRPNELLEVQHGNYLDSRAAGTAGGADPHMATVGEVHRAEVTGR